MPVLAIELEMPCVCVVFSVKPTAKNQSHTEDNAVTYVGQITFQTNIFISL